ncbi:PAS domain S-box protein [Methanobacterium alcaliphilum]|uniref:PAS domain S-box protein n=1 Tax=Methanobacterium alcaliphilum TaxID=392018 RepID=UPI00200A8E57|nr:PAS domain S-box protein [Methanobacterium alcaliphilum]MCK9151581.1 PAS domain S-box protein [Methanobacterium alcaliphilum]
MEKKILIVEDEALTSMEIEAYLELWGYSTLVAPAGEEAIQLALEHNPHLILMDIVLKGEIDGINAVEKIKEAIDVPVIYLSAYNDEMNQNRAKSTLPHHFLAKPFNKQELKFTIEMALIKHEMEKKVRASEKHYRILADNVTDIISVHDPTGLITYISPSCENITGYTVEECIGKNGYDFIHPQDLDVLKKAQQILRSGDSYSAEFRLRKKDGSYLWVETNGKGIFKNDSVKETIVVTRNISQRKSIEEKLKKSLEDNKMLLREINHRVKNDLMLISSLMNLQCKHTQNQEAIDILQETRSRAYSMALVHQMIYKSSKLEYMNFEDYIGYVTTELFRVYQKEDQIIKLKMDLEEVLLDVNFSIPLALILNELVVNALKHAFPDLRNGNIKINLHKTPDGHVSLEVADDGVGAPSDFSIDNTDSFGFEIIKSLVIQIKGSLETNFENGTKVIIKFKI